MNYLITGGAGFLGAALANRLASTGHQVRVIDDLSAGDAARLDERVLFSRGDVNDRPKLWTLLQDVQCVYHLAARVSVSESVLYPREYNAANVSGTVSVMEAMRDVGVQRVVLASSGAVYGNQRATPLVETMVPDPGSPYAVSKLAAEHYVRTIGRLWGIETVVLRVFNAYGPGQPLPVSHPPVVPHFIKQVRAQGTIVVHGDGQQTRDFVYVDDVVDALVAASMVEDVSEQVINIGSGQAVSIRELVDSIGQVLSATPHALYQETVSGGVVQMRADVRKAAALLAYRPKYDLMAGLRHMLARDPRFALS